MNEFLNRCPACKQVSDADSWEVGGSDPGYQFCPICSREAEPINLYLESLGCEQTGRINHEGPFKAEAELAAWMAEEMERRSTIQQAEYELRKAAGNERIQKLMGDH